MNSRKLKFRTPTHCQNSHFSWLFWEVKQCVIVWSRWEQSCKCSSGNFGEGWGAVGPDQQFTGLQDRRGVDIYEGDIVQPLPAHKYDAFTVLFDNFGFDLSASADYEVVGHVYMK